MDINAGNRMQQNIPANDADGFVWPSSRECRDNPHRPDCNNRPKEPFADENAGYADSFCECHDFKEPLIHANETDISWPAGWDEAMADIWRTDHGLSRPNLQG